MKETYRFRIQTPLGLVNTEELTLPDEELDRLRVFFDNHLPRKFVLQKKVVTEHWEAQ